MKHNAAIYLLSSRILLLEKSLKNLFVNWNYKYDYPVHVHYFNNIYSKKFIKKINDKISKNIFFHQINYELPINLKEEDLFYNKTEIPYVKKSFPKKRLGYLHGERFWLNLTSYGKVGCLVKEMSNVGTFDLPFRIENQLPAEISVPQMIRICDKYKVMMKAHNCDYLSNVALKHHTYLGIHAINVAPEFGVIESKCIF